MSNKRKILVADDDQDLARTLAEQLDLHEEFEAQVAHTAAEAIAAVKGGHIDLILLDVGLPDMDGREACRILRKNNFKNPVVMLTAQDGESDTVLGLEAGANDYVTKPFRFAVLLARIRAQLRQHEHSEEAVFNIGEYTFRPAAKLLADKKGGKVRLTEKETSILKYLYRPARKSYRARNCCTRCGAITRASPRIRSKPIFTGSARRSSATPRAPNCLSPNRAAISSFRDAASIICGFPTDRGSPAVERHARIADNAISSS